MAHTSTSTGLACLLTLTNLTRPDQTRTDQALPYSTVEYSQYTAKEPTWVERMGVVGRSSIQASKQAKQSKTSSLSYPRTKAAVQFDDEPVRNKRKRPVFVVQQWDDLSPPNCTIHHLIHPSTISLFSSRIMTFMAMLHRKEVSACTAGQASKQASMGEYEKRSHRRNGFHPAKSFYPAVWPDAA